MKLNLMIYYFSNLSINDEEQNRIDHFSGILEESKGLVEYSIEIDE